MTKVFATISFLLILTAIIAYRVGVSHAPDGIPGPVATHGAWGYGNSLNTRANFVIASTIQASFNVIHQKWFYRQTSKDEKYNDYVYYVYSDNKDVLFTYDEMMKLYMSKNRLYKRLGRMMIWMRDIKRDPEVTNAKPQ